MPFLSTLATADESPVPPDRILVAGNSPQTLDMLRLATIRSDDVVVIAEQLDDRARLYAQRFAVEWIARAPDGTDIPAFSSLLVASDEIEAANGLVRAARRAGVPVHVSGRPLVSDFSPLEFLERRPSGPAAKM